MLPVRANVILPAIIISFLFGCRSGSIKNDNDNTRILHKDSVVSGHYLYYEFGELGNKRDLIIPYVFSSSFYDTYVSTKLDSVAIGLADKLNETSRYIYIYNKADTALKDLTLSILYSYDYYDSLESSYEEIILDDSLYVFSNMRKSKTMKDIRHPIQDTNVYYYSIAQLNSNEIMCVKEYISSFKTRVLNPDYEYYQKGILYIRSIRASYSIGPDFINEIIYNR